MAVSIFRFPRSLIQTAISWRRIGSQISGGQAETGGEQSIRTDGGGRWIATLSLAVEMNADGAGLYNLVRTRADDGAAPILVPYTTRDLAPWPLDANGNQVRRDFDTPMEIPHSDGSLHSDGTGYQQRLIVIKTVGDVGLHATEAVVRVVSGDRVRGGMKFSARHTRELDHLYEIGFVRAEGPGLWRIRFLPPTRQAIPSGTYLNFEEPCCLMKLPRPDEMELREEPQQHVFPVVSFVETFLEY